MTPSEAQEFILKAMSLSSSIDAEPILRERRDRIAAGILRRARADATPPEMIVSACLVIAANFMQAAKPVEEKPLVELVQ